MKIIPMRSTGCACVGAFAAATLCFAVQITPDLAACFRIPERFANERDDRRSPLLRPDGGRITTVEAWQQHRREIRDRWFELMGPWPELLARPRLEILNAETRDNFVQHRIRIEVAADTFQNAILQVPSGPGPFPAVVVPYYEPETSAGVGGKPLRDFGYQLAKRGFVALSLGSPDRDRIDRRTQPLSFMAYIAANCHTALSQMPGVDPARIGIVGHSYGGKWALFASCLYEKFACGVWSDPGIVFDEKRGNINYWEPWYLGFDRQVTRARGLVRADSPRTGAYKQMMEEGRDLHELHALMAPRPFLVSGGAEDPPERWRSLQHAIDVNRLYALHDRVGMHNRKDHSPTEESNAVIYRFLEHVLGAAKPDAL